MTNNSSETPNTLTPNPWGFEVLINRLYDFVDGLEGRKRVITTITWVVIAAVLITAASFPLPEYLSFISPIVGFPAGIILFALILSAIHTTRLKEWKIFQLRETTPQKRRLPVAILLGVSMFVIIIFAGNQIPGGLPTGVGGAIMIATVLSIYNTIRRTPYEMELSLKGEPDPREYSDDEEYYEEPDEDDNYDEDSPAERNNR